MPEPYSHLRPFQSGQASRATSEAWLSVKRAFRPWDVMQTVPPSAGGALPAYTAGEPLSGSCKQPDSCTFFKATAGWAAKGK
jgi:hypothetical protein